MQASCWHSGQVTPHLILARSRVGIFTLYHGKGSYRSFRIVPFRHECVEVVPTSFKLKATASYFISSRHTICNGPRSNNLEKSEVQEHDETS